MAIDAKQTARIKGRLVDYMFLFLGVSMASVGLKGFVLPGGFLDGGAMGISLLLKLLTNVDLSVLVLLVNLPFVFIGGNQISKEFAVKSVVAISVLAVFVHFLHLPHITDDKLLISIFGGFFLGAGIGLTIRAGAVIDGTEVLAIAVSRKTSLTVGDFITLFNATLFLLSASLIGIETAMYSMLTYLSASKTIDFVIHGIEEYLGVMVVSEKAEEIKQQIVSKLGRGVTILKSDTGYGKRGELGEEGRVLFCVVTRLEVTKLLFEVEQVDPHAFVVQQAVKDTKGGMIKKRPLH